jgi:hypothetical protein
LTFEHLSEIKNNVISYFKSFPISLLSFDKNEIKYLTKLLINPLDSIECQLGQYIVDNLVWHEETLVSSWQTKPSSQRSLILGLVDVGFHSSHILVFESSQKEFKRLLVKNKCHFYIMVVENCPKTEFLQQ